MTAAPDASMVRAVAPKVAVFLHVATMGRYQFILDEVMNALRCSSLPAGCDFVEIGVVGTGAVTFEPLDCPVRLHRRSARVEDFEHPTLAAIQEYCIENIDARVLYLNCLGGRHVGSEWEIRLQWRLMLYYVLLERQADCLAALQRHDVCAVQWLREPLPHATSNNWWATARHIAALPTPLVATEWMNGIDLSRYGGRWGEADIKRRHSAEFWLGMRTGLQAFSMMDLRRTGLPLSEFRSVAWWGVPGVDWRMVAQGALGDRPYGWFDLRLRWNGLRWRYGRALLAMRRCLPATRRRLAATNKQHRH